MIFANFRSLYQQQSLLIPRHSFRSLCILGIQYHFFRFRLTRTATTRRVRNDRTAASTSAGGGGGPTPADRSSKRKQCSSTARRHHSVRRGSQYHEVHIAMLPDLSGRHRHKNPIKSDYLRI